MNEYERVALAADLPEGEIRGVELSDGAPVCLARADGEVYAVGDRCPHADYPMSDGCLEAGAVIECALHGARFALDDGRVLEGPAVNDLLTFDVRVENGEIWVRRRDGE